MKYIFTISNKLLLAWIMLVLLACRKDDSANTFPADLKIDSLLKLLPDTLRNKRATTAVFSNGAGTERRFKLRYEDTTLLATAEGRSYAIQKKSILYTDIENKKNRLWIVLSGNYSDKTRVLHLTAGASPSISNPILSMVTITEGDDSRLVDKRAAMDILDRTFTDVYCGTFQIRQAFTQICYNQAYGIIGYRGAPDQWWVFRRFE